MVEQFNVESTQAQIDPQKASRLRVLPQGRVVKTIGGRLVVEFQRETGGTTQITLSPDDVTLVNPTPSQEQQISRGLEVSQSRKIGAINQRLLDESKQARFSIAASTPTGEGVGVAPLDTRFNYTRVPKQEVKTETRQAGTLEPLSDVFGTAEKRRQEQFPVQFPFFKERQTFAEELESPKFRANTPLPRNLGLAGVGAGLAVLPEESLSFGVSMFRDPLGTAQALPKSVGESLSDPTGFGQGKLVGQTLASFGISKGLSVGTKGLIGKTKSSPKVATEFISEIPEADVSFGTPKITRTTTSLPKFNQISARVLDVKAVETGRTLGTFGTERATFDISATIGFKSGRKAITKTVTGKSEILPFEKSGILESEFPSTNLALKNLVSEPNPQKLARVNTILSTDIKGQPVVAASRGIFAEQGQVSGILSGQLKGTKIKPIDFISTSQSITLGKIKQGSRQNVFGITGGISFAKQGKSIFADPFLGRQKVTLRNFQRTNKDFLKGADLKFRGRGLTRSQIIPAVKTQSFAESLKPLVVPEFKSTELVSKPLGNVKIERPIQRALNFKIEQPVTKQARRTGFPSQNVFGTYNQRTSSGFDTLPSVVAGTKVDTRIISSTRNLPKTSVRANTRLRTINSVLETESASESARQATRALVGQRQLTRQRQELGLKTQKTTAQGFFPFSLPNFRSSELFGKPFVEDSLIKPVKTTVKRKKFPQPKFYQPSLGGIEVGAVTRRRPRFVSGGTFGVRPIVIAPRQSSNVPRTVVRSPSATNSLLAPVHRGKSRMQLINEFAVYAGGKARPQIPNPRINLPFNRKQSLLGKNTLRGRKGKRGMLGLL